MVDQYISVESRIGKQSFDSSYSSETISSELAESSTAVLSDSAGRSQYAESSEERTRLQEYKEKVQTGYNSKEGIRSLDRILFESPPRTRWWKAIVAATGYWILLFFILGSLNGGVLDDLMAFGALICWLLLPIAIFMDSKVDRVSLLNR